MNDNRYVETFTESVKTSIKFSAVLTNEEPRKRGMKEFSAV